MVPVLFPHALVDAPLSVQQVRHIHKGREISHFLVWFQFINVDPAGRSLPESRPGCHLTVMWHLLLLVFSTSPSAPHPFPCTAWPIYPISPLGKEEFNQWPFKTTLSKYTSGQCPQMHPKLPPHQGECHIILGLRELGPAEPPCQPLLSQSSSKIDLRQLEFPVPGTLGTKGQSLGVAASASALLLGMALAQTGSTSWQGGGHFCTPI